MRGKRWWALRNRCNETEPADLDPYRYGVAGREIRPALARPFLEGKIDLDLDMMITTCRPYMAGRGKCGLVAGLRDCDHFFRSGGVISL
jgi:hypothetical protein